MSDQFVVDAALVVAALIVLGVSAAVMTALVHAGMWLHNRVEARGYGFGLKLLKRAWAWGYRLTVRYACMAEDYHTAGLSKAEKRDLVLMGRAVKLELRLANFVIRILETILGMHSLHLPQAKEVMSETFEDHK